MKISQSSIQLNSDHSYSERSQKNESLVAWQDGKNSAAAGIRNSSANRVKLGHVIGGINRDSVSLSTHIRNRHVIPERFEITEDQKITANLDTKILRAMFERLTGRKFHVIEPMSLESLPDEGQPISGSELVEPGQAHQRSGFGLIYYYHESYKEFEKTSFSATGVINTADGKEIDFSLDLSMSREFYSEQNLHFEAGDALKDPLVINFSGTAAQLTKREFSFDIDSDGFDNQISFVKPGSGFLALDRNGDNTINNGSELFGTLSGDGFQDLSLYDSDNNMWIDENDGIFDNLRIWSKNGDGEDQLVSLGMAGVGALYLGHIETSFSLKDGSNSLLGQVRSSGLAVMESGGVVTMQQLDLVA